MATASNVYRAYSMEYGTFVGLGWGGLFLCYVEGISTGNALLMLLCFALFGICGILPFFLAFRLNHKLFIAGEKLSYLQGLFFAFSMFMYACLMNGVIAFSYFQFLDDGTLYEQLNGMLTQPEMVSTYRQMGMGEQYSQMMSMLKEVNDLSVMEKALAVFNNNFFFSIFMSFIVAIAASYNLKNFNKGKQQ
ncbi:MAG: DUF4199 domain-containing protein [Bacteroidaceae bacterium]|nr:DUF4199 domain-containing protein [Bacteroidaceae bacterium]